MPEPHITKGMARVGMRSWKEIDLERESLLDHLEQQSDPQPQEGDTDGQQIQ